MSLSIFVRGVLVTADKNAKIYYKKAPVIIFGLLFPLFMFISFYLGREIDIVAFFPGFLAMTLFFTASALGPLITPWEKQAGTYERLLSYPVTVGTILAGDALASLVFGTALTSVVLVVGLAFLGAAVTNAALAVIALFLGSACFAGMGVLLASTSSRTPSNVMMLSSLIRFPLIFVSGVFVPLSQLDGTVLFVSYASPLTYLVDLFNVGLGGTSTFPAWLDILVLALYTTGFMVAANALHRRSLAKGN